MMNRILNGLSDTVPAVEWFLDLPTPADIQEFDAAARVLDSLREKPGERLCIWFPDAPELLMEIRHCAGGYLVKECTDFDPEREELSEALRRVKFQFYYESAHETKEMLKSFCCGEDALVTVEKNEEKAPFCWKVQLTEKMAGSLRSVCL